MQQKNILELMQNKKDGYQLVSQLEISEVSASQFPLNNLPEKIMPKIFEFLEVKDVANLAQVNKKWRQAASEKRIALIEKEVEELRNINYRQFLYILLVTEIISVPSFSTLIMLTASSQKEWGYLALAPVFGFILAGTATMFWNDCIKKYNTKFFEGLKQQIKDPNGLEDAIIKAQKLENDVRTIKFFIAGALSLALGGLGVGLPIISNMPAETKWSHALIIIATMIPGFILSLYGTCTPKNDIQFLAEQRKKIHSGAPELENRIQIEEIEMEQIPAESQGNDIESGAVSLAGAGM